MTKVIDTFSNKLQNPISSLKVGSVVRSNTTGHLYIKFAECGYFNMSKSAVMDVSERFNDYVLVNKLEAHYD